MDAVLMPGPIYFCVVDATATRLDAPSWEHQVFILGATTCSRGITQTRQCLGNDGHQDINN